MLKEIIQDLSMLKHRQDGLNLGRKRGSYFYKGKNKKRNPLKFRSKILKKRTKVLIKYKSSVLLVIDEAYRFVQ